MFAQVDTPPTHTHIRGQNYKILPTRMQRYTFSFESMLEVGFPIFNILFHCLLVIVKVYKGILYIYI